VNSEHLRVKFLRRGGLLVEPVEVEDVLAGLADDARRGVVVAIALVSGYDGSRIERLDDVESCEPVPAALRVRFRQVLVYAVVCRVAGHNQPYVGHVQDCGVVGVGVPDVDGDQLTAF
jgi:hypothetical protein